jgi:RNA recognition motif-containing protein
MGNKLYVGNLAYSVRDDSLQAAFAQFGTVTSAKVMMDRETGRSKGFGFVEMGSDAEAQAAINGMNGQALDGRPLVVNEARPREERPGGFGGGGGSRSGGGGGGYGGGGGRGGGGRYR